MAGQPVQIGPFSGGLNTYSDQTTVADNQLVRCENFELDLDGSLRSRWPFADLHTYLPLGETGNMQLLGYYYAPGNVPYLLASDGLTSTYYLSGTSWTLITATFAATAMAQFNGFAYLLAPEGSSNPGGHWSPLAGFSADANMPKGEVIVAWRFRLWVAIGKNAGTNSTRLYFSAVLGQPTFWPASPDFIDIGAGDGQSIVQLIVYFQSLLIFRTGSVFALNYTSDPASGVVSSVLPGVGLENKDSLVNVESYLYFLFDGRAYEFVNNRASQINQQVPFESPDQTGIYQPFAVSKLNQRVIFSYYSTLFVFNLRNRTWTTWTSTEHGAIGKIVEQPLTGSDTVQAVASCSLAVPTTGMRSAKLLSFIDGPSVNSEPMVCTALTKNYDYQASGQYKKLLDWGVNALFRGQIHAAAHPTVLNARVTWADALTFTWADALKFTWGAPMSASLDVVTDIYNADSVLSRPFIRCYPTGGRSLPMRFRQVAYEVSFNTDGLGTDSPVRLFTVMTYVLAKEHVSKALS